MTDLEQKINSIKKIFQESGKSQAEIETIENKIKDKPELLGLFDNLPLNCPEDALDVRFQLIMNS